MHNDSKINPNLCHLVRPNCNALFSTLYTVLFSRGIYLEWLRYSSHGTCLHLGRCSSHGTCLHEVLVIETSSRLVFTHDTVHLGLVFTHDLSSPGTCLHLGHYSSLWDLSSPRTAHNFTAWTCFTHDLISPRNCFHPGLAFT